MVVKVTSVGGAFWSGQIKGAIDILVANVRWAESFFAASNTVSTVLVLLGFLEVVRVLVP